MQLVPLHAGQPSQTKEQASTEASARGLLGVEGGVQRFPCLTNSLRDATCSASSST